MNNAGDPVDAQTRWRYAASTVGPPKMGSYNASEWNLRNGKATDYGFETFTDPDGYFNAVIPLLTKDYTNTPQNARGVYVTGSISKFAGATIDPSAPLLFIRNDGTRDMSFLMSRLENTFESTWALPKTARIFCATFIGSTNYILVGGRFTKHSGSACGHLTIINAVTGQRAASVVLTDGTLAMNEETGGGTMNASFTSIEQNVYARQSER
jgi:hypothetical protein